MHYIVLWSVLILAGCASTSDPQTSHEPDPSTTVEGPKSDDPSAESGLTSSERRVLIRQIGKCWNVPVGARDPKELQVDVKIEVNRDRTVKNLIIVELDRMYADSYFRAMAESAKKALSHPDCKYLKLPPEKYDSWKEITLTFDPTPLGR